VTPIEQAVDEIENVLKAFRQNNVREQYLKLLDEIVEQASGDWRELR